MKINTCLLSSIRDGGCLSPCYHHDRQSPSENNNDGNNHNIFTTVLNDLENGFRNPLENADLGIIAPQEEVVRYDLSTLSPTFRGLNLSSPTRRAVAKAAAVEKATGDNLENSLLGRSQARRMKLQQSYNEIISSPRNSSRIKSPTTPTSEQWQQQYSQEEEEEERDDRVLFPVSRSYAAIKSPRVQKMFNFDIRDDNDNNDDDEADNCKLPKWNSKQQRREYRKYIRDNDHDDEADNNNHHGNNTDTAPPKWNSTQQRREYRKSLQKSSQIDIAEIEQFTKDMRMRIQRYNDNSPKMMVVDVVDGNKKDEKKKKQRQQLEVVEVKKEMNVKRQSHSSVVKKNISTSTSTNKEDTTTAAATVASRWKALRTKQKDDNNDYITDEKTIRSEKEEVPDDEIEAWWNERLQNAAGNKRSPTTPSASDRLDERLKSLRNNNKIKQQRGSVGGAGGTTTTAFRELEGEPTLEDDIVLRNVLKKKVNFIAPLKEENGDATTTPTMTRQALNNRVVSKVESTFFDTDAMNKKQRNVTIPSSSVVGASITVKRTTPRSSSPTTDSQSHSQSNSVASGTLQIILTRIDEAKEQFAKALKDNDVKKQSELAALLAQLGEAAVAMRKLGQ